MDNKLDISTKFKWDNLHNLKYINNEDWDKHIGIKDYFFSIEEISSGNLKFYSRLHEIIQMVEVKKKLSDLGISFTILNNLIIIEINCEVIIISQKAIVFGTNGKFKSFSILNGYIWTDSKLEKSFIYLKNNTKYKLEFHYISNIMKVSSSFNIKNKNKYLLY